MNVTSLFYTKATKGSQGGVSGLSNGQTQQAENSGFEAVLSKAFQRQAPPKKLSPKTQQQTDKKSPAPRVVSAKGKRKEDIAAEVVAFVQQAAQPKAPAPPPQAADKAEAPVLVQAPEKTSSSFNKPASDGQENTQAVTVQVEVQADTQAEAEQTAQAVAQALREAGFAEEDIQQMVQVVAQTRAEENAAVQTVAEAQPVLETTEAQVVQPAQAQAPAQETPAPVFTVVVELTVEMPTEAPVEVSSETAPAPEVQPVVAQAPQSSIQTAEASFQAETVQAPIVGMPQPTAENRKSTENHDETTESTPQAAPQAQAPEGVVQVVSTASPVTLQEPSTSSETAQPVQENTSSTSGATARQDQSGASTGNTPAPAQTPSAMTALGEFAAALAEAGQEVTVRVRHANQDQTPAEQSAAAAEEERLVLTQKTAPKPQAAPVTTPVVKAETALPQAAASLAAPLQGALNKTQEQPRSNTENSEEISLADVAQTAEPVGKPIPTVSAPGQKAYGQALGRFVKLGNVETLLKDLSQGGTVKPERPAAPRGEDAAQAAAPRQVPFQQVMAAEVSGQVAPVSDETWVAPKTEVLQLPADVQQARVALMQKISQRTVMLAATGAAHSEVRLQLKPDHLGDVRMTVETQEGVVRATFIVESLRVQEILQSGLGALRQELQQSGLKLDHFQVSVRDQSQTGHEGFASGQGGQGGQGTPGRQRGAAGGEGLAQGMVLSGFYGHEEPAVNYLV